MKRIVSVVLSVILALSLTCCGSETETTKQVQETTAAQTTRAAAESTTEAADESTLKKDGQLNVSQEFLDSLKGFELTIVYPWALSDEEPDTEEYDYRHIKEIEETYGVTITTIGKGNGYESAMVTSVLSGKPLGNVLMCPEVDFVDWYYSGIMTDLTDAAGRLGIDMENDDIYNHVICAYTNVDDGQYCFSFGYENTAYSSLYYNKRILEEHSLEDPHALKAKGEWTWDKLEEYAKICQVEESDGSISVYGYGAWTIDETLTALIYSNDGNYCSVGDDGQLYVDLTNKNTTEAMERFDKWCNVDSMVYVSEGSWKASMKDFVNGSYAFLLGTNEVMTIANETGMEDEFGIITFPSGPSNTSGQTNYQSNDRYWFIPVTYEQDADKILFLMDLIRRSDTRTFEEQFEEEFFLKISDEASYNDYMERMRDGGRYSLYGYSGIGYVDSVGGNFYGLSNDMYWGYKTAGTLISSYNDSLNASLRDTWDDVVITGNVSDK